MLANPTRKIQEVKMQPITYKDLDIAYEDNHIIVVIKPFNIPSQADITGDMDMLTLIKQYQIGRASCRERV